MKIILASASPRRRELLHSIFDDFEVCAGRFDENSVKFTGSIEDYVKNLAFGKAEDVRERSGKDSIIISADTVVCYENNILGKPADEEDAFRMLKMLSGKSHYVYTGVTVLNTETKKVLKDCEKTKVFFSEISDEEIREYIKTGEPMDKAGSYGIQGRGGVFVKRIEGCFYNVVGLPLNKLKSMLKEFI